MKLHEIKMTPNTLRADASKLTTALVGIEFELIVKDVGFNPNEDFTPTIDYSVNEHVDTNSWRRLSRDIMHFFSGDSNTQGEIEYILDQALNEYEVWLKTEWDKYVAHLFLLWINRLSMQRDNPLNDATEEEQLAEFKEQHYDHFSNSEGSIENWIGDVGLTHMKDWAQRFDLTWPYYTEPPEFKDSSASRSFTYIANSFKKATGLGVNFNAVYHQGERTSTQYVMEPDGSLVADSDDEMGLEFVSPPMSVSDMIKQIHAVKKWAIDGDNAYTNSSCGLHMNVSFPEFDLSDLDYIKLAVFLGDDWVSKQFGRLGAHYCKSALADINNKAIYSRDYVTDIFDLMKKSLMLKASQLIHSGVTEKYVTINTYHNRVEFRAPGGNWLEMDINIVINTMLRCIVALSIALDPEKYKTEYAAKLYKLISPNPNDIIDLFSQYQSGKITITQLKHKWARIKLNPGYKKPVNDRAQPLATAIADRRIWKMMNQITGEQIYQYEASNWSRALEIARKYAIDNNIPDYVWDVEHG